MLMLPVNLIIEGLPCVLDVEGVAWEGVFSLDCFLNLCIFQGRGHNQLNQRAKVTTSIDCEAHCVQPSMGGQGVRTSLS